jgi:hypothetical protein
VLHHRDPVAKAHGLDLVVRHVDCRGPDLAVEPLDLVARVVPELRVQVRERLVEQEHAGLAHQGPAQRHALALAAGELARVAVEVARDVEQLGRPGDALLDAPSRRVLRAQRERDVLAHGAMRIERVALEHHGDAARARRHVGARALAVDEDLARAGMLEPGDHAQQRRLAAARGPEENEELAVRDAQVHAADRVNVSIVLLQPANLDRRHETTPISPLVHFDYCTHEPDHAIRIGGDAAESNTCRTAFAGGHPTRTRARPGVSANVQVDAVRPRTGGHG